MRASSARDSAGRREHERSGGRERTNGTKAAGCRMDRWLCDSPGALAAIDNLPGGSVRANQVDTIQRGFRRHAVPTHVKLKRGIGDRHGEVLRAGVFVHHASDAESYLRAPAQPTALHSGLHLLEFGGGRRDQLLALVRPRFRQLRLPARNQAFTGIIRMIEFEEVAIVEESQLQRAAFEGDVSTTQALPEHSMSMVLSRPPSSPRSTRRS
jgi:hypothetical protein